MGDAPAIDRFQIAVALPAVGCERPSIGPRRGESKIVKYRDLDPDLGRWLSEDPVGLSGGVNLYQYANNNPVNRVDTLGLTPTCIEKMRLLIIELKHNKRTPLGPWEYRDA